MSVGTAYRPMCGHDESYDWKTGQCYKSNQQQASDLALQGLRNAVNGTGGGGGGGGTGTQAPVNATPVSLPGMPATYHPSSSSNTSTTTTTTTSAPRAREAGPQLPKGTDAALLRAKDQQGQIARSAVTGLRSVLGERGMLDSGAEAGAMGDIANSALGSISNVNREGLIQNEETQRQFGLAKYQGDVTQRGQDIGESNDIRGNSTAMRGQDINAAVSQRGQDISARGQDISAQLANAGQAQNALQFQQQLQQQQMNNVLSALRGLVY